jgi:hypothetical protein
MHENHGIACDMLQGFNWDTLAIQVREAFQKRPGLSPRHAGDAGHEVEVGVARDDGQTVLGCDGGDPEVVHRNGGAGAFQETTDAGTFGGKCLVRFEAVGDVGLLVSGHRLVFAFVR